jgi:hypothetical protein
MDLLVTEGRRALNGMISGLTPWSAITGRYPHLLMVGCADVREANPLKTGMRLYTARETCTSYDL